MFSQTQNSISFEMIFPHKLNLHYIVYVVHVCTCRSQCSVLNESSTCSLSTDKRIAIYFSLAIGIAIFSSTVAVLSSILFVRASQVLHNRMFSHVLRAPIHFFDTNPIGKKYLYVIHIYNTCA